MNNQVLRVVVMVGAIFPFVVLGFKLYEEESLVTAGLYTAVVVILFATVFLAWRTTPTPADPPPPSDSREAARRS